MRRIRHSGKSAGMSPMKVIISGAAYGAARPYIVSAAQPVIGMLPFGAYNDHIALGLAGYLLAKKSKGLMKTAGTAILYGEAFSIGSGVMGGGSSSSGGAF